MAREDLERMAVRKPPIWQRDRPRCVKYILLILLVLLLAAEIATGQYATLGEKGWIVAQRGWLVWLILLIKLFLIALLIALIRLQQDLKCELSAPTGCTAEEADPVEGALAVSVEGTASGGAFGGYILEVRKVGYTTPIADVVSYPGGGSSGASPVVSGVLGQINTTGLMDDAYQITLTVHPAWGGSPKSCSTIFNLLKAIVCISRVGEIPVISQTPDPDNPNVFDEGAELHKDFAASPPPHDYRLVSVGGQLKINGAAYVYECPGRKIARYEIRYAQLATPGPLPAQPATDAPIPVTWPASQQIVELVYSTADHYLGWTRVGPAPRELTNTWTTFHVGASTYYKLAPFSWSSGSLNGRFSLLLVVEDTTAGPHRYFDIQHVWIDNRQVTGKITGVVGVDPCEVFHLKDFLGSSISIQGLAWDPLIDEAFDHDSVPNDNFGGYTLAIYKQGVGAPYEIASSTSRVPAAKVGPPGFPSDADADTLAVFDIAAALDGGNSAPPPGVPAALKIPRGEGCAYYFELYVWDNTRLNNDSTRHHTWYRWPFCVANDMPKRPGAGGGPG
jgi:hypothetical protein